MFKVGDKVIIRSKSIGDCTNVPFKEYLQRNRIGKHFREKGYVFITYINSNNTLYTVSNDLRESGDYFLEKDLFPYDKQLEFLF